jgi:hypothetical protein
MKIASIIAIAIALLLGGAFIFFAVVDMPVRQTDTVQEIPHDRFGN